MDVTVSGAAHLNVLVAEGRPVTVSGVTTIPLDPTVIALRQWVSGNFYPLSNPSGYCCSGGGSGSFDTGILSGYVQTGQTGAFITTGQTGAFAPAAGTGIFITTAQTGVFLTSVNLANIVYQTGNQTISGIKSFATGIAVTGDSTFTGTLRVNGNPVVTTNQTGTNVSQLIVATYNIASGNGISQFIQFAQNFAATPNVLGSLVNNSGDVMVSYFISGASISGFYLAFSEIIPNNNYAFSYIAIGGSGLIRLLTV